MLATLINSLAIIAGSLIGLLLKKGLSKRYEFAIFTAAGVVTIVLGIQMALKTTHILSFTLALILGGLAGTLMDIEGSVLRFGEFLKRRFAKDDQSGGFAFGFLSSSVLFCSGSMAILGSFEAGAEGNYTILFTKSLMDGFISILFASAMGAGVIFSALSVLAYQGILTLAAVWLKVYVTDLMQAEIAGVGGALLIMIGINLLDLKKLKTGDFIPSILFCILFVLAMPYISFL